MADENLTPHDEPTSAPEQDTPPMDGGGLDFIPEQFREESWATKYKSADDFWGGINNLSQKIGQRPEGLVRPGEEATPEEVEAFNASLREMSGVPGSLEDYQGALQLPELGEGAMMPMFIEMGFKNGVAPQAMQSIISGLGEALVQEEKAASDAYEAHLTENMNILKKEWGDDYDHEVNVAERFASELSDETMKMLTDAKWNDKAPLVRDMNALAKKFLSEGDIPPKGPDGGNAAPTMAGLSAMKEDPRYADVDKRDDNYVAEVRAYAQRLTDFQNEEKKRK
ncbi:MAG: hypothetical protein JEY79_01040 [Pseudodesulfovibrio sp.]|nr:hypothetical protein [Pseudodesulfovibrio sp.]